MESEYLSRLAIQLESQTVLEAKILLEKLYNLENVKDIVEAQWLPLLTDVNHPTYSRMLALVESTGLVGYGSVLLNQPNYENVMLVQEWLSSGLFLKINVVIDGEKVEELRVVAEKDVSPQEISSGVMSYVNWMFSNEARKIGYALTTVSKSLITKMIVLI